MPRAKKLPNGLWKRGDVYYARFSSNGRPIRKRLSSDYRAACELLNELKARADRADFGILDNDYSWADLKTEFLRWAKQQTRIAGEYESTLKKFEEYLKPQSIRHISQNYVMGFRQWRLGQKVTPRTVNKQVLVLNGMLNKAVEWGYIASNPIRGLKPLRHDRKKKERRSLTADEVATILQESPGFLRPVWLTFMTTGLRLKELVELRFRDVDLERRVAIVRPEISKNHQQREVPLCDEAVAIIRDLAAKALQRRPVEGITPDVTAKQTANFSQDHVFVSGANTPLRNNLLRHFYAICKKAGIRDAKRGGAVDIHALRVSFTTLAIENGADPKSVQEIIGHSSLHLTMNVYTRARSQAKRDVVNALPFAKATAPRDIISIEEAREGTA
ncbi:tyrosine-type recombinase/integrase [Blastopirellula sp. JC732]|uniref:Tyrosine-type recombinase/integrase n=2 Tax=Blastopirellula sediminis TaxID=2894196 RepID=A0A9X1MHZ3_9BACT|nr:tyrosine-type recombinase/integrase [Blastopirellula sediminis]MCC9608081.1 tyrosine-type recombinase/integrase [Blastopirellula sediminis]MCC9627126.1 tyrosine-type recombinase/integrase [Blastopirellula sediminis]